MLMGTIQRISKSLGRIYYFCTLFNALLTTRVLINETVMEIKVMSFVLLPFSFQPLFLSTLQISMASSSLTQEI